MTDDLLFRRLRPSPDALASRVGEETVILHLGNDTYYSLDAVGTRIWELAQEGPTLAHIRDQIAAEYAVDPAQVEGDLRRFVGDLLGHKMLVDA